MKLQDYKPPVFVRGQALSPEGELDAWLVRQQAAQRLVKLPVAIWRRDGVLAGVDHAEVGLAPQPRGDRRLRLDDSRLGIALAERLRQYCPSNEVRCVVWISGQLDVANKVFVLAAVHGRVDKPDEVRYAEVERAPSCLAIRTQLELHCARGPKGCAKCAAAAAKPPLPRLLDLCPEGEYARPTVSVVRDGKLTYRVYDVLRSFADATEAKAFADKHGIVDVQLAPER